MSDIIGSIEQLSETPTPVGGEGGVREVPPRSTDRSPVPPKAKAPPTFRELGVKFRTADKLDMPFIFSSWLRSYKGSPWGKPLTKTVYFTNHHKILDRIVARATITVACDEKDSDQILGWVCTDEVSNVFCVHYAYVKHAFRGFGIVKALLSHLGYSSEQATIYTHFTYAGNNLAKKYNWLYQPYVLYTDEFRIAS